MLYLEATSSLRVLQRNHVIIFRTIPSQAVVTPVLNKIQKKKITVFSEYCSSKSERNPTEQVAPYTATSIAKPNFQGAAHNIIHKGAFTQRHTPKSKIITKARKPNHVFRSPVGLSQRADEQYSRMTLNTSANERKKTLLILSLASTKDKSLFSKGSYNEAKGQNFQMKLLQTKESCCQRPAKRLKQQM